MAPVINKIDIKTGSSSVFVPNPQNINQFDSVFWVNHTTQPHQPAPDGGTANQWVDNPIQPGGESSQVTFNAVPASPNGTVTYHCALHPNDPTERGAINVTSQS